MSKPLKKRSDPLAPHAGPVMCAGCDYENQVRGEWRDGVFYPSSEMCAECEAKAATSETEGARRS